MQDEQEIADRVAATLVGFYVGQRVFYTHAYVAHKASTNPDEVYGTVVELPDTSKYVVVKFDDGWHANCAVDKLVPL